jgi:Tfp pilus assembly protein PilZ
MAILLFEQQDQIHIYRVIFSNDHQYRISEHGIFHNTSKSYHINRKQFDEIMAAAEPDRLKVAKKVYHAARLKKKNRGAVNSRQEANYG